MNKARVGLDVDDVLAAFTPYTFQYFGVKMPERLNHWSVLLMDELLGTGWFNKIMDDEDFWLNIPYLSHPSEIDFKIDCYISSFPQKMQNVREAWLRKNGFPNCPLVWSGNKLNTCRQLGINVLVDDKPSMMLELQNVEDVRGIHFISPYSDFEPIGEFVNNLQGIKHLL